MLTAIPCTVMRGGTSKGLFFSRAGSARGSRAASTACCWPPWARPHPRQIDGAGRRASAHQQGGGDLALAARRRRRGLSIPAGGGGPGAGLRQPELRQPARPPSGPWALENGLVPRRRRRHAGAHPHGEHRAAWPWRACDTPRRRGAIRRRRAHRWRAGHGRARSRWNSSTSRAPAAAALLPTGNVVDDHRGRRNHLHRQWHARDPGARGGSRRHGRRNAGAAGSERSAARQGRSDAAGHGPAHESGRRHAQDRAQDLPGQRAARGAAHRTATFIPHRVHEAIGVLGAVSVATACVLRARSPHEVAQQARDCGRPRGGRTPIRVSSRVDVDVEARTAFLRVRRAALVAHGAKDSCKARCSFPARLMGNAMRVLRACWALEKGADAGRTSCRSARRALSAWDLKFADGSSVPEPRRFAAGHRYARRMRDGAVAARGPGDQRGHGGSNRRRLRSSVAPASGAAAPGTST